MLKVIVKPSAERTLAYSGLRYMHTYIVPGEPGTLFPVSGSNGCREYFVMSYREKINRHKANTNWAKKANALLSLGQHSCTATYKHKQKELTNDSALSLKIINKFEKAHNWPLTKLYPVQCTNLSTVSLVFFQGSKRWTMSPYLMSIWSLVIRLGRNPWLTDRITDITVHKTFVSKLFREAHLREFKSDDAKQLASTVRDWDLFLDSYKRLFASHNRKHNWSTSRLKTGVNARPEGIRRLLNGTSGYEELKTKWRKIKQEATKNGRKKEALHT